MYGHLAGTVPRQNEGEASLFCDIRWAVRTFSGAVHHLPDFDWIYSGSAWVAENASMRLHHLLAKRPELEKGDYAAALTAALADEDALLLESFKNDSAEPAISGSTAAICLVNLTQGELVVCNIGDSHVILAERDPKTNHPYHIVRPRALLEIS